MNYIKSTEALHFVGREEGLQVSDYYKRRRTGKFKSRWNVDTVCVYIIRHLNLSLWSIRKNTFYRRLKKSNKLQQYVNIYLLLNYSTCFGHPSCPSSVVHKTVVAASGKDHNIWGASFFKRDQIRTIWSRLKKLAPQILWSLPEAATTIWCTPDDMRDGCPKHVE